jgi:hypothetical protein
VATEGTDAATDEATRHIYRCSKCGAEYDGHEGLPQATDEPPAGAGGTGIRFRTLRCLKCGGDVYFVKTERTEESLLAEGVADRWADLAAEQLGPGFKVTSYPPTTVVVSKLGKRDWVEDRLDMGGRVYHAQPIRPDGHRKVDLGRAELLSIFMRKVRAALGEASENRPPQDPLHEVDAGLERVAKAYLDLDTLRTRNSDRLDFYQIGVGGLADALAYAFDIGFGRPDKGNLPDKEKRIDPVLAHIAKEAGVDSLVNRGSDRLDFHEMAVWTIERALEASRSAGAHARREAAAGTR